MIDEKVGVSEICPGCDAELSPNVVECPECGLQGPSAVEDTTADLRALEIERDSAKHEAACVRRDLEVTRQTINGLASIVGVEVHSGRAAPDILREIADHILREREARPPTGDAMARRHEPSDTVNHPAHYGGDTPHEVIKCLEAWGLDSFCLGNAVKYIARVGKKNPENLVEDLEKARWYLDREITRRKST